MMNQLMLIILVIFPLFFLVDAQSISNNHNDDASSGDTVSKSRPSLAIIIGILCAMFALTLSLVVACTGFGNRGTAVHGGDQLPTSLSRTKSGFDKRVIESLPFFRFSSIKGSKQGLECAVCLSNFEDIEVLRLLPHCKHAFHVVCIDEWLEKHSSCPLCRRKFNADDPTILTYSNSSRFLRNGSNSNVELHEDHRGSSRFSIGTSSRKIFETADNDMSSDIFEEFKEINKAIENENNVKIKEELEMKIDISSASTSRVANECDKSPIFSTIIPEIL